MPQATLPPVFMLDFAVVLLSVCETNKPGRVGKVVSYSVSFVIFSSPPI